MSAFHRAVQDYVASIRGESQQELASRANAVLDAADQADERAASWALMALTEILADPRCPYHAMTACLCEPLMRQGGDPWLVVGLLIERFGDALRIAVEFREELRTRCGTAGVDPGTELRERGNIWKTLTHEQPASSYIANSLELFCLPLPPIVSHFPQARQLLRANPAALDNAIRLAGEVEGLDEIIHVVESNSFEPLAPQHEAVEEALTQLRQVCAQGAATRQEISAALMALYRALFCAELATRNDALEGLAGVVSSADVAFLGEIGQFMGSIVETGGNPRIGIAALMGRLPEVLDLAGSFLRACRTGVPPEEKPAESVQNRGREAAEHFPREARAFESLPGFCLGVIALLSRSPESRKQYCGNVALLRASAALSGVSNPAGFLRKMLQVLDDEALVIVEPERQRGWRVRIRGIADNFQLHTLLAGALIGPEEEGCLSALVGVVRDGRTEKAGRPLDEHAVGLARNLPCTAQEMTIWSQMQLWTWQALQPDETLPENPLRSPDEFIVWNEGVPADIPAFEGERTLLVSSVPISRTWIAGRIFHGMHGDLTLEATLTRDDVASLVHCLAVAPR